MSVGEASIGLTLGTAQLDADTKTAERILNRIGRGVIENGKQAEKAIAQLSAAGVTSVDRLQRSFNTLNIKTGMDIENEKRKLTAAFEQIKNSGVASAKEIERAHASMKSKMDGLDAPIKSATGSFGGLSSAALAFAGGFSIQQVITQLHAAGMAAERLRNSFEAATGSAAKGTAEFGFARSEAQRLGLDLLTTSEAYLKLAASARGTALEGQKTRDIFSAVSGAGRSLGLSGDQMSGALLAISQMMSKGTVQAEELRGQLGERLPGAFNIAARAMGVTTAELGKMLEGGKVISEDFLPKFAMELEKTFPPGEKAMNGMTAETMRLKTAWYELKATVMEGGGESMFTNAIRGMKDLVKEADSFYGRMSGAWRLLKDFAKNPMDKNLGGTVDVAKLPPLTKFDIGMTGIPDVGTSIGSLVDRGRAEKLTPMMTVDAEARAAQEEEMKAGKKSFRIAKPKIDKITDEQKAYQSRVKEFLKTAWDDAAYELSAEDFSSDITKKLGFANPKAAGFTKNPTFNMGVDTRLKSLQEQDSKATVDDSAEYAKKLKLETDFQRDMYNVKADAASSALGLAKAAAGDNKALQIAAMIGEKALSISRIMMNTEVAVSAAIASAAMIPVGGLAIGQAQAATIRAMSYVSIGMVVASGAMEGINISGARANGGPVTAGQTYLVNENRSTQGPEYFTPGVSGTITPANKMNGGDVIIPQTFHITGVAADLMQNMKIIAGQAKDAAKAEILNSMNRGGDFALASGRIR